MTNLPINSLIRILSMSVLIGFGLAYFLYRLSFNMWWLQYFVWRAYSHRTALAFIALAFGLFCFRRFRWLAICLFTLSASFWLCFSSLESHARLEYLTDVRGRVGTGTNGAQSIQRWLIDLKAALLHYDNRSDIFVTDIRSNENDKSIITLSWHEKEKVEDILKRLSDQSACKILIDIQGNPLGRGPFFGVQYNVTLRDLNSSE